MEMSLKTGLILLAGAGMLGSSGCGGGSARRSPPPPVHNEWTWMGGSSATNQSGNYGTQGTPSPTNSPGARVYGCSWTDSAGNFWLFGGYGAAASILQGDLNDFWKYSNGEWTWIDGSNQTEQAGVYGTMGTPAPANFPGARWEATCWTDPQGNFWLYGGLGIDSQGTRGNLGDLWRYSNGEWTWMAGSNVAGQPGVSGAWQGETVFGTKGVPSASNTPGARASAVGWADPSGNLWLFGGQGVVLAQGWGEIGLMNDLWEFGNGMWTWMAGPNQLNQYGIYGTLGVPSPSNIPGSRFDGATWTDANGNFWLFGGDGSGVDDTHCEETWPPCNLNDLWKYSNAEWTWVGGPEEANEPGVYGTQGAPAPGNIPPPRNGAVAWIDPSGDFWLFGGIGPWDLNDLWRYSNGEWTWVSGADQACQAGVYGALGAPSATNVPGARDGAVVWTDKAGNLWLFGGEEVFCVGNDKLNDLWEYQP